MKNTSSKYNPAITEDKWYKYWLDNKLFKSVPDDREPYTIVIGKELVNGSVQIFNRATKEKTTINADEIYFKIMELL